MTELSNLNHAKKTGIELSEVLRGDKDLAAETATAIDTIIRMSEGLGVRATALACARMLPEFMEIDLQIPEGSTGTIGSNGAHSIDELSNKESTILQACYVMSDSLTGDDFYYVAMAVSESIPDVGLFSGDVSMNYQDYQNEFNEFNGTMQSGKRFYTSLIESKLN